MIYPELPNVEIIELPVARWEEYRELRLHALSDSPRSFGEPLASATSRPDIFWTDRLQEALDGSAWLVFAEAGVRLVGMAGGYRINQESGQESAGIWGVYVLPGFRGNGIAERLMNKLMERMAVCEIRAVRLMVNPEIAPALNLYQRLGFTESRRFQDVMGDGCAGTLIEMTRTL